MTCLVIQFMLQKGWINNHYNIIIIITDFSFFSSFQPVQRKVTIVSVPFHFYKSSQCKNLACENIHFSLLFVAVDVSRRGTSATQQQKSHTDDANQCLHNKSGSHGVPNINLSNFTCLLVDFGKVLCSSANKLQQNSNASSREDYIPQILTVLLEILRVYIWPLWPFVFCLSFVNNS